MSFGSEPDIKAWTDRVALNPARIASEPEGDVDLTAAAEHFRSYVAPGLTRLADLAGMSDPIPTAPVRA